MQLNNSLLLQWVFKTQAANDEAHFLCDQSKDVRKCTYVKTIGPDNLGPFVYKDNTIDYSLYKATDANQSKVRTCRLRAVPQILIYR